MEQKREWIRQIKSIMLNNAKISVPKAARDLIMKAECNWDEDLLAFNMWQKNGNGTQNGIFNGMGASGANGAVHSTPVAQRRRKSVEIAEKFRISKKYFRSKSSSDLGPASREKEKRDSAAVAAAAVGAEFPASREKERRESVAELPTSKVFCFYLFSLSPWPE